MQAQIVSHPNGGTIDSVCTALLEPPSSDGRDVRLICTGTFNILCGVAGAAFEMKSVSSQNMRTRYALFHCAITWKGPEPSHDEVSAAVAAVLEETELDETQCLYALHAEGDTMRLHISVNRMDLITFRPVPNTLAWTKNALQRAALRIERDDILKVYPANEEQETEATPDHIVAHSIETSDDNGHEILKYIISDKGNDTQDVSPIGDTSKQDAASSGEMPDIETHTDETQYTEDTTQAYPQSDDEREIVHSAQDAQLAADEQDSKDTPQDLSLADETQTDETQYIGDMTPPELQDDNEHEQIVQNAAHIGETQARDDTAHSGAKESDTGEDTAGPAPSYRDQLDALIKKRTEYADKYAESMLEEEATARREARETERRGHVKRLEAAQKALEEHLTNGDGVTKKELFSNWMPIFGGSATEKRETFARKTEDLEFEIQKIERAIKSCDRWIKEPFGMFDEASRLKNKLKSSGLEEYDKISPEEAAERTALETILDADESLEMPVDPLTDPEAFEQQRKKVVRLFEIEQSRGRSDNDILDLHPAARRFIEQLEAHIAKVKQHDR